MATVPAIVGAARLGNFRLGYQSAALKALRQTKVRIMLAGADVRVRVSGLSIRDQLNESPNTATFTIASPAPTSGQALRITINSDTPRVLFVGTIQTDTRTYQGKPTQLAYPVTAIDDTARVNKHLPFGTFVNVSATTVAQTLTASFAPGFSSSGVAASLPLVTITFDGSATFMGCLARLATLIGGYSNVEDGVVKLFLTDTSDPPDAIDSTLHRFLDDPPITVRRDDSQLATRVYGKGHGEALSMTVAAGETVLPIDDVVMYNPLGGKVIVGTTPDGADSEILAYTGVQTGGGGALVGPGVTPSVAPTVTPASGAAGLGAGVYQWAYSWVTGAGETVPGPLATVTLGDTVDPSAGPTATADLTAWNASGAYAIGDTLTLALSFSVDFANTIGVTDLTVGGSIVVPNWTGGGSPPAVINYTGTFTVPTIAKYFHVWVKKNADPYRREITNPAASGSTGTSGVFSFPSGGTPPAVSRSVRRADLAGVAIGPTGTTQRKLYRTAVGAAQLKLQQTIANNTATVGVQDTTVDGSLGANAPTSDTSGLTSTSGQINAGSTSILTSGTGPFSASGGWVRTSAGELVRYTGISGNSLTGIPASGVGAILTSILYSSQVIPVPALIGVSGVVQTLQAGAVVHLWVQRDDLGAQADAAIRESTSTYLSDGVHEITIVDERRGEASLSARCDAHIALFANPITTASVATRDVKTKSGKPLPFNLASPPIVATLTIQDVTITEIDVAPGLAPRFTVTASSVHVTLEDVLRRLNALLED
jgi:hypothetical protein